MLTLGLAHFSEFIAEEAIPSDERKRLVQMIGRMHTTADYLITWLPSFYQTAFLDFPDDVAVVLQALPRVKRALANAMNIRTGGPGSAMQRKTCVASLLKLGGLCMPSRNRKIRNFGTHAMRIGKLAVTNT